jgi:hypothetical protein
MTRQWYTLAVILLMGGAILLTATGCSVRNETDRKGGGRYEVYSAAASDGGLVYVYLVDTRTGRTWQRVESGTKVGIDGESVWEEITPRELK